MGGSGAPTEWDDVLGWMPEVLRIHVDAAVAHLRRTMGSSDPEGAFELAFRLCDVTEHATRYCALLAVAVASADEGLRHGVLAELGRMARHKPSFGHWTGLLRTSLAQLDRAAPKALPPPARLSRRRKKDLRAIGEIVNHRNRLAHGASGRYVLHPEQVAALSERVLGVLAGLEDLLTAELQEHRDRLYWHEGEESTFLHPLIVPAPDGPPLLFDHLHGGKRCPVFRGPDEDLRRADLRPAFDGLLRGDRARFEPLEVETLTLPELHERADVVRREPLPSATRWPGLLTALAPLGGRPLFGERLVRGLADGEGPRLYHVYGALGAGKQRFLADVFGRLRAG